MNQNLDLSTALLDCWRTTSQVSVYLVKVISPALWNKKIPGYPRKTIGMLLVHLHNARCMWIKAIGKGKPGKTLTRLDPNLATKKEVLAAMNQSGKAILDLLAGCIENGGRLPSRPGWLNFPNDVMHLLAYFVAHEAHHRGQIIMAARQLGYGFKRDASGELWQWVKRHKESRK